MKPEILERIKKLLRLGQSSNSAEAALAMQRAFELASKHGVEVESLDLDERTEKLVHEYFQCGQRPGYLRLRILNILVRYFRVEVCLSYPRVVFAGRESDVQIAGYVYEFLVWAGQKALRDFIAAEKAARRTTNAAKKNNFTQGFIYGIASQLEAAKPKEIEDSKSAIVLAEKAARQAYIKELIPNQETKKLKGPPQNRSALMRGWDEGKQTNINQPLNGGQRETLALTA